MESIRYRQILGVVAVILVLVGALLGIWSRPYVEDVFRFHSIPEFESGVISGNEIRFFGTLFLLAVWIVVWAIACAVLSLGGNATQKSSYMSSSAGIGVMMSIICIAHAVWTIYWLLKLEGGVYLH